MVSLQSGTSKIYSVRFVASENVLLFFFFLPKEACAVSFLFQTMLSDQHMSRDLAPRLVSQTHVAGRVHRPQFYLCRFCRYWRMPLQENTLCFPSACEDQTWKKTNVYVRCLFPSNPPQSVALAGPLGVLCLGGLRGFPAGPHRTGWSALPYPPAGLHPIQDSPL